MVESKEEKEWTEKAKAGIAAEFYIRQFYPEATVVHMPKGAEYDMRVELPDGSGFKMKISEVSEWNKIFNDGNDD